MSPAVKLQENWTAAPSTHIRLPPYIIRNLLLYSTTIVLAFIVLTMMCFPCDATMLLKILCAAGARRSFFSSVPSSLIVRLQPTSQIRDGSNLGGLATSLSLGICRSPRHLRHQQHNSYAELLTSAPSPSVPLASHSSPPPGPCQSASAYRAAAQFAFLYFRTEVIRIVAHLRHEYGQSEWRSQGWACRRRN